MRDTLTAGIAVYNAGEHHAAHDAWEDEWLALESGTTDEQFLHGLIQFTAAVYHARRRNWSGATGLATSAREYLADVPDDHRGVAVDQVSAYLRRLGADPEYIERARPLELRYEGQVLDPPALSLDAVAVAAAVVAEEYEYDETVLERAVAYAREERGTGRSTFVTLLVDFVENRERRGLVYDRLSGHVDRRERRRTDVEGLFGTDEGAKAANRRARESDTSGDDASDDR